MNGIYLYHQILKGKWFIHYSYALSMKTILNDLLSGKSDSYFRNNLPVPGMSLEQNEDKSRMMVRVGTTGGNIAWYPTFDSAPDSSIAIIRLRNVMLKYGTECEYGTEEVAAIILQAAASKKIDGIVLDIDSGGGAVDSVPPMLEAIKKAQELFGKPVIGCADMCASAAYYVGSHCDRLIAANDFTAEFGSIGVMAQFWDIVPYFEKEGYKFHKIYAPESTHKNLPFERALKGDYRLIKQEELSPLAIKFMNDVKARRGNKLNMKVEGLLNGRMFYASNSRANSQTAVDVGLIDAVGNMDMAILMAQGLAESKKLTI